MPENSSSPFLHSDDNLYKLLTSSESRPEGAYNHATWDIQTRGEVDSDAALITSVHEAMHDHLNNSTAYGLLLIVTAHLAREEVIDNSKLVQLVNACRNAHEIFATYSSLLIVSQETILFDVIQQDYPAYSKYVHLAQFLLQGVDKNHLQYPIINSLIRVCFQNPALVQHLQQETLFTLKPEDSPDHRLTLLSKYLNPERLQTWLTRFVETHASPEDARHFVEVENDLSLIRSEAKGFDAMGQSLSDFVYDEIKNDKSVGFAVMGFDDHLDFLDDLLAYANKLAPMSEAVMPLIADKDYDKIDAVSQYESEAVVFNETPLPAVVIPFSEYPIKDWHKLLARVGEDAYLYIISRITERFVTQYQFSDEHKAWLLREHPDFVVTIAVKQKVDDVVSVVFVVLNEPNQLRALDKQQLPMMTNSSMFLTSDHAWEDVWHDAIAEVSSHTLLFDLSPSTHLQRSLSIYDTVYYNSFHLETDKGEFAFIVLIGQGENVVTGVFFMPCSAVMSNLMLTKMQDMGERFQRLDPDKDLSEDLYWLLRVQMTRLLDETRFDCKAVSSQYAIRGFENDRFYTAG